MEKYFTKILTISFLCLITTLKVHAQPTPPAGYVWKNVPELTDEFDSWNSSKWTKSLWNYGVPVQMKAENSGVTDGNLWIKATLNDGAERWFETSRVMSKAQISYPMYTECRMRTAHISAYNTFWLNNGDSNNRDEFDICENNSKPSITSQTDRPYTMYSQYFIVRNGSTERHDGNFDNRNLSSTNPLKGVKWNEEYHTLGAWWIDENQIQFYLDGEEAGYVNTTRDFTLNLNIIWDLWTIDATWSGGIANKNDLKDDQINTMYIDWIHTYSLDISSGIQDEGANEKGATIYPNPATNTLNIDLSEPVKTSATATIFDQLGQVVLSKELSDKKNLISVSNLTPGIYIVKVLNGNTVYTQSVIIK